MVPLVRLECLLIKIQLRSLHAHPNFQWSPTYSNRFADLAVQYKKLGIFFKILIIIPHHLPIKSDPLGLRPRQQ